MPGGSRRSRVGRLTCYREGRVDRSLGSAFLMVCHAQAALPQWDPGVRGGRARRKLCQGRRRIACHAGCDQPDGAASRATSRRAAVRAQGQSAGADGGGPRLSGRLDADLRSTRQLDGAGHGDGGLARADGRRRADLRHALAHSAAGRLSRRRSRRSRFASRPAARRCPTTTTGPAASASATATGRSSSRSGCSRPISRRSARPRWRSG